MAAALSLGCLAVSSRCRLCKYDTPLAFRAFKRGSKKGESRRRIGEKERAADRRRGAPPLARNCSARFSICSLYDISTTNDEDPAKNNTSHRHVSPLADTSTDR